jgi:simple sugar transport system permease protein
MRAFERGLWPLRLERRALPSVTMRLVAAPLAVLGMLATVYAVLAALGQHPGALFRIFFVAPLDSAYGAGELFLEATPLMLCALGLAPGYRAEVWNIGAEGQLTMGAIGAATIGLYGGTTLGPWTLALMATAGVLGGMAWAAIPALLRTTFRASEILVSLMLVYVAQLFLSYVVHGPLRDPAGANFPQSPPLAANALLPLLVAGTRVNIGIVIALGLACASWWFERATAASFRMRVGGLAPRAAAYAGFSERRNVWLALMIGGGAAGLAGFCEVAGPLGMLQPKISPGYGFTAIIVAFLGRLHPLGIVLASLLMAALSLGGESAQIELGIPASFAGVLQGALLFFLLAAELSIRYRMTIRWPSASAR